MKVIFLEDHGSARVDDIKTVKSGYARFLIQYGKAIPATPELEAEAEKRIAERVKKLEEIRAEAEKVAAKMTDITLTFTEKANEEGQLFGSVTEAMVAEKLEKEEKLEIKKEQVNMTEHLKKVGEHEVKIHLADKVDVKIKVVIEAGE